MTDEDLCRRLRSVDISWSETGEWCAEAADRIEALSAENERLRERVEQHEAFHQDVSDKAQEALGLIEVIKPHRVVEILHSFIITKPDPLVEALDTIMQWSVSDQSENAKHIRAALAKRGLEIREIEK